MGRLFNFELFPNPANTSIAIKINQEPNKTYLVEIYNIMGQFISSHRLTNALLQIDTQTMSQGIYICKVFEIGNDQLKKTGALTKRFLVQH